MGSRLRLRALTPIPIVVAIVLSASLVGCGGGGGSASTYRGRSFSFTDAARSFYLSVDTAGRFTLALRDSAVLAEWVGAQGSFGSNDRFFTQTPDGLVQFEGQADPTGQSISCVVRPSGAAPFTVTAAAIPSGTSSPWQIGSFAASGADTAYLTLDAGGHSTLWVKTAAARGGALASVNASGVLSSSDNSTIGQLTQSGTDATLELTRLNGSPVSLSLPLTRATRAKWTFLVYLNAANDLQEFGPLNVNQMEKIGSTADVNIVVQWKQADCLTCGSPSWVSTRRYYITRDQNTNTVSSQLVEDLGPNVDMGDWRELNAFIRWTQQRYPADHYALVVWDHGAGWRSTRAGEPARLRSVSIDDSTNNEIQIWQLPQALNVSQKVDLLIFDASLMQMLEVAYEVREVASLMVGSEESPPGEGYVYDRFLGDLATTPTMNPQQLATQIVTRTLESYGTNSNITQSAVDLTKVQTLADRLNAFATSLSFYAPSNTAAVVNARKNAEAYLYRDNKDLWHYAELVRTGATSPALQTSAAQVQQALQAAVVSEAHGTLHPNSHGLAIYIPAPSAYLVSYVNLALARVTEWDAWLQNQPPG
jgi:hypothetical protein